MNPFGQLRNGFDTEQDDQQDAVDLVSDEGLTAVRAGDYRKSGGNIISRPLGVIFERSTSSNIPAFMFDRDARQSKLDSLKIQTSQINSQSDSCDITLQPASLQLKSRNATLNTALTLTPSTCHVESNSLEFGKAPHVYRFYISEDGTMLLQKKTSQGAWSLINNMSLASPVVDNSLVISNANAGTYARFVLSDDGDIHLEKQLQLGQWVGGTLSLGPVPT